MRIVKHVALGATLISGIFSAVLYTSCSKDASKSINCFNHGSTTGGTCACKPGTGGNNCEILFRKLYANTYTGNTSGNPGHRNGKNTLTFVEGDTTDYNGMQVTWQDSSYSLTLSIALANNTSSGSSFTVTPTVYGSKTYTGGGSLSSTVASMSITETDTSGAVNFFTFNSFYRQ